MGIRKLLREKTFQRQFIFYFSALLLIISMTGYFIFSIANGIIREQSEKYNAGMLDNIRNDIDSRIRDIDNLNVQLLGTPWLQKIIYMKPNIDLERINELEMKNIYAELSNYKANNSFIEQLFVYFKNSDMIFSPYGKANLDYFLQSTFSIENYSEKDIKALLSATNFSTIIPNIKVQFFTKNYEAIAFIRSSSINRDATIVTIIQIDKIESILAKENKYAIILDKKGDRICGSVPFPDDFLKNSVMPLFGDKNYQYKTYNNQEYGIFYTPSKIDGWKLITVVPVREIFGRAEGFRNAFLAIFVICIITGFILYLYLTKRTLMPLQKAISNVKKLGGEKDLEETNTLDIGIIEKNIFRLSAEKDEIKVKMDLYSPMIRNSLLLRLVKGYGNEQEGFVKSLKELGVEFNKRFFRVLILEVEKNEAQTAEEDKEIMEAVAIITKTLNKLVNEIGYSCLAIEADGEKIIMVENSDQYDDDNEENELFYLLPQLQEKLQDAYNVIVTVGIGNYYDTFNRIARSYHEAQISLSYKMLIGKGKIIKYNDLKARNQYFYYYPTEIEVRLTQSIKLGDYKSVDEILKKILFENFDNNHPDISTLKCLFYDMEATLLKVSAEIGLAADENIVKDGLSQLKTFDEMTEYIRNTCRQLCEKIENKNTNYSSTLINKIINDIDTNFTDANYSLEVTAGKFNISKSYISKFFREQTGMYYSDYLNRKRIERAKQLLQSTEISIKDIATSIGYVNDITFRRLFKQYENYTPGNYRNRRI